MIPTSILKRNPTNSAGRQAFPPPLLLKIAGKLELFNRASFPSKKKAEYWRSSLFVLWTSLVTWATKCS